MRAVVTLLAVAACQAPPKAEPPPPARVEIFVYARPYVAREELPARFSAPLPSTLAHLADASRYPPEGVIAAALERGDADMRTRVEEAVRRAARGGPVPPSLAAFYDRLFGARPSSAACEYLHTRVRDTALSLAVRAVFWPPFARCGDSRYAPAFARGDAPDRAVVAWATEAREVRFTPRLGQAALALARRGRRHEVRTVGLALARVEGPRGVRAARELQRKLRDAERRALIGVGFAHRPEEAARLLARRACGHPSVRFEPACASHVALLGYDLDAGVRAVDTSDESLVAAFGESSVIDALARCVNHGEWDEERARCLRRLAGFDWTRAVAVASSVEDSSDATLLDTARALIGFPKRGGLETELRELGLIVGEERATEGVCAADILVAYERAVRFDAETGEFPNQHDRLLRHLATLVRPDLDGVAFEEAPPAERGDYRLRAWADGKLYELRARNLGDWYDVPAVVGLLNSLLRARASRQRLLIFPSSDQVVTVLGAPAEAIEAAVAAEILAPRRGRRRRPPTESPF